MSICVAIMKKQITILTFKQSKNEKFNMKSGEAFLILLCSSMSPK
jgi:hypothetical protein